MANGIKINNLNQASSLNDTDTITIVQDDENKKMSVSLLDKDGKYMESVTNTIQDLIATSKTNVETTKQAIDEKFGYDEFSAQITTSKEISIVGVSDDGSVDVSSQVQTGFMESAILKGQTLVNLLNFNSITSNGSKEGDTVTVSANGNTSAWLGAQIYLSRAIEMGKLYIVMWNNLEYTHSHTNGKIGVIQVLTTNTSTNRDLKLGQTENDDKNYVIFSCNDDNGDLNKIKIAIEANTWATEEANNITIVKGLKVLEYRDGMENWDIPYFEGVKSVENPIIHTIPMEFGKGGRL